MNPLPNRPLLNNVSMPLSVPNVPSFEQIYNGRPRKTIPDNTKEFPLLNGMTLPSAPSSAPTSSSSPSIQNLEPRNPLMSNILPSAPSVQLNQQPAQPTPSPSFSDKEKSAEPENRQLTAIFRADDDWRQRLRDAPEQIGSVGWDRRRDDEDKEEEPLADDEESTVLGEGDDNKVWKAKRTLRKYAFLFQPFGSFLICLSAILTLSVRWHSTPPNCVWQRVVTTVP
jgi:striatin 1/3/4